MPLKTHAHLKQNWQPLLKPSRASGRLKRNNMKPTLLYYSKIYRESIQKKCLEGKNNYNILSKKFHLIQKHNFWLKLLVSFLIEVGLKFLRLPKQTCIFLLLTLVCFLLLLLKGVINFLFCLNWARLTFSHLPVKLSLTVTVWGICMQNSQFPSYLSELKN